MTKHLRRRTTLGRWWAFVTLWVAIVTLVFSGRGIRLHAHAVISTQSN